MRLLEIPPEFSRPRALLAGRLDADPIHFFFRGPYPTERVPGTFVDAPWHHLRVSFRVIGVVLALSSVACGSVDPDRVAATLRLPSAPDCQPMALRAINVTALGDFATSDATVEVLLAGAPPSELSGFPRSTLALSARATTSGWDGFGYASVEELRAVPDLLILPVGRSCAIADPEARLPRGAAIAVLSGSRVLVAGGLDEHGVATRRLAVLEVRTERAELPSPTLANRLAFASATLVPGGESVLVAGGASSESGEVRDTWERVSLVDETRTVRPLRSPRRDHGAIAVGDGPLRGVLLVGGSDGAQLLDTIEWVDVDSETSRTLSARLTVVRRSPSVAFVVAHTIAIFGGETALGAPAPGIDLLDLETEDISPAAVDPGAGEWSVALPDGRIAVADRVVVEGSEQMRVRIVLRGASELADAGSSVPVFAPVVAALASGRILIAGREDDASGERVAMLFDPSVGVAERVSLSPVPTSLVGLPDGTTLALDEGGASIRRDDRLTPFDSPRPLFLFADDRAELSLDAASRWQVEGDVLVARAEGARIGVPVLRFRDVSAELDAEGPVSLALVDETGADAVVVGIDAASVAIGACRVARTSADPVRVTRLGAAVELSADGVNVSCAGPALAERVGIAVVADTGARLRSLALSRLP